MVRSSWLLYLALTLASVQMSHSRRMVAAPKSAQSNRNAGIVQDSDAGATEGQDEKEDGLHEDAQQLKSDSDDTNGLADKPYHRVTTPRQAWNYAGSHDYGPGGPRPGSDVQYNPGLVDARGNSLSDIDWAEIYAKLPAERTTEAYKKRSELWRSIDINGNGGLSLAEIDKGIRDILKVDAVFNCKPAIMRAYQAAKGSNGNTAGLRGDTVQRNEFRVLLEYLRKYFELYVMYRHIDVNFDGRVSFAEFSAPNSLQKLDSWGISLSNPVATFNKVDVDGGGMILFDEFAHWAIERSLTLGDSLGIPDDLEHAEGPSDANLVHRPKPDVVPHVSLSLNGAEEGAEERLTNFYTKYAPHMLSQVTNVLRKYRGKETLLWQLLEAKYKPGFDDI